jgi:AraC-like DNA-binding protein
MIAAGLTSIDALLTSFTSFGQNSSLKIVKEMVTANPGQSFRLFTPRLKNYFFWHYHPEIELVYVEAVTGIRHVGQHISNYMNSDLVLIGPNIPHLNFDYGVQTEYMQIVVQLPENFIGTALTLAPEFADIRTLFDRAAYGLAFDGHTKAEVGTRLKVMQRQDKFTKLISLLDIFRFLADSTETAVLNETDTSVKFFVNDKIRMGTIYEYVQQHYQDRVYVDDVAALVHLSTPAFCRYFKKHTRMTFTDFVNQYRISQARTLLLRDSSISAVSDASGFQNISHFNKLFKKSTGDTPSAFRKKYSHNQKP